MEWPTEHIAERTEGSVDLFTTIRILARRWYVVLPALLLTVAGAAATMRAVAPTYEVSAAVVLLGPATAGAPVAGQPAPPPVNPYLEFGGALETTGLILSRSLMSESTVDRLAAQGATATYEVGTGSEGGSPIVNVIATGPDQEAAKRTAAIVMAELRSELARRQVAAGAPASQFIRVEDVTRPDSATRTSGSRLRAVAAVMALGIALSFGLGFMAEAIAARRAGRAADPAPAPPSQAALSAPAASTPLAAPPPAGALEPEPEPTGSGPRPYRGKR